jgi:hypothetical protein
VRENLLLGENNDFILWRRKSTVRTKNRTKHAASGENPIAFDRVVAEIARLGHLKYSGHNDPEACWVGEFGVETIYNPGLANGSGEVWSQAKTKNPEIVVSLRLPEATHREDRSRF